jgi:DNA-binding transcriptional LysR family regulator
MADSPGRYKQNRLQQLRGFCYAARTKSISKAAEKMHLSQPSVSLQIKALETELGTQLFTRRGPRIELTHDGQRLLELARPLVESIDRLDENFASLRDSADRGVVSIAAGGSTIQYLLPRVVEKFTHECPQVDVRLHNVTGKAGLALLREGEVDFAVGPMLETPPDIKFHPLVTYEPMLITRHDHPLAAQSRVTLKDIAKYPLILPPKNQSTYRVVEMVFAEHSLEYDVKLEVGGYDVIKKYVELGLGISIVMSHCLTGADHLHSVPLGRWFPKRTYGLVLRKGAALSPAAERFVEMMRADAKTLQNGRGPRTNARGNLPQRHRGHGEEDEG